ncbi:MAG: lactate utilization protein [Proteobacteria bacterium]|nr:lactate utilization protein [Pseudomonadota bacterium]
MSARHEILQRVRAGVGKATYAARRAAAEASLRAPLRGPQPSIGDDLVARFQDKALSLASSIERISDPAALPGAIKRFLAAGGLPGQAVVSADLASLDWLGSGLEVAVRPAVDADRVGISSCFCAIAETGTLMLLSGAETPATVSLLPETHIALVPRARIVATMEDAFALLRAERGGLPRAINFISGPSRTGDIEQTIVLGAHGPCRVHLILSGESL